MPPPQVRPTQTNAYHVFQGLKLNCSVCGQKLESVNHPHNLTVSGFTMQGGTKTTCVCREPASDAMHHQDNSKWSVYPLLHRGMTGRWVGYAQTLLMDCLGHQWGFGALMALDGPMVDYVKEFQKKIGIPDDGVIGPITWKNLHEVSNMNKSTVFKGEGVPDWFKETLPPGMPWAEIKKQYDEYLKKTQEPRFRGIRTGQSQFDVTVMVETPDQSWELVPGENMGVSWGTDTPNVRATARAMIFHAFQSPEETPHSQAQDMSYAWYDVFAERIVAHLPRPGWDMTFDTVRQVINAYEEAAANGSGPTPRNNTGSGVRNR